ncbi:DNA polymerase III subunit gamma/tau [Candidatus Gracilibacteria bacterium]|nr:DNA polymerase III subunit gamma/tau [Candidatus Gracilibacteria bacterium]
MSLYTKYRPKDWDELIGQDIVRTILQSSIQSGKIGHAYIFTGSRGTGKTSSARIFAKAINCENPKNGNPCHECKNCRDFDSNSFLDVIEMDAASHTQVDNMRELIEAMQTLPTQGKYKIYIIDEVHMLSGSSFNAFLKTLEEPPAHVKFILATTEIHKVPETIRSRALRFDFGRIPTEKLYEHLKNITAQEGISTDDSTLKLIAQAARGGARDALTILEQNTIDNTLSKEHVMSALSLVDENLVSKIVQDLFESNTPEIKKQLENFKKQHIEVQGFFDSILYFLRDKLIENIGNEKFVQYDRIIRIFQENYRDIKIIPDGILLLEITLLRACQPQGFEPKKPTPTQTSNATIKTGVKQPETPEKKEPESISSPQIQTEPRKTKLSPKQENEKPDVQKMKDSESNLKGQVRVENFSYRRFLDELKGHSGLVFALKSASFTCENTFLTLSFTSQWNYNKVNEIQTKTLIQERLSSTFGGDWTVECKLNPNPDTSHVDDIFV